MGERVAGEKVARVEPGGEHASSRKKLRV